MTMATSTKAALLELQRLQLEALERLPVEEFEGVGERVEEALGVTLEEMVALASRRRIELDADSLVAGMLGGAHAVVAAGAAADARRPLEDA